MPYDERIAGLTKDKQKRIARAVALEQSVNVEKMFPVPDDKRIIKRAKKFEEEYLLGD